MAAQCRILGIGVNVLTMEEALQGAERLLQSGGCHLVVTPNAEMMVLAQRDMSLRQILNRAALVLPDGAGVVLAGRLQRKPMNRVPGVDFAKGLLQRGRRSVFLLGGEPGVAEEAASSLRKENPFLEVRGTAHGFFTPEDEPKILTTIRESGAEVLLAGLGSPKQEKWLDQHLDRLGVILAVGVGGALDVFAGRVERAPAWMGRFGLEWLYRLYQEPKRAGRMLAIPRFLWSVLRERA